MEPNSGCGTGGMRAAAVTDLPAVAPGDRVTVTYDCGARLTSTVARDGGRLILDIPGGHFVVRDASGAFAPDIVALELLDPA